MRPIFRFAAVTALAFSLLPVPAALAQNAFAPVVTVNERAVTQYELDQRIKLLRVFGTTGDLAQIARDALIEDRLKQLEIDRVGMTLPPDALQSALQEFAGRAQMDLPAFEQMLAENGVDAASLRDFIAVGVMWRDYVRARFGRSVNVTDTDIDRALGTGGMTSAAVEVLLSEIIIAPPPEMAQRARDVAQQIAAMRSFDAFSDAARQVSALPSRDNGGQIDWVPIGNYPPQIGALILDLEIGEVTEPITIPNAIALFQLRGLREAVRPAPAPALIDYAVLTVAGDAAALTDQIDRCDDLYGVARDLPRDALLRETATPAAIAADIALELARLDANEISTNLTRGDAGVLVMLCQRLDDAGAGPDREALRGQIRSDRLSALAAGLLEDLRAQAVIRTP